MARDAAERYMASLESTITIDTSPFLFCITSVVWSARGSEIVDFFSKELSGACMVVGKVVFEGATNNVNRGIPSTGHTSSNRLSRCCVVCEYAVCQVNTDSEVVIVVHIQHTLRSKCIIFYLIELSISSYTIESSQLHALHHLTSLS